MLSSPVPPGCKKLRRGFRTPNTDHGHRRSLGLLEKRRRTSGTLPARVCLALTDNQDQGRLASFQFVEEDFVAVAAFIARHDPAADGRDRAVRREF